MATSTRYHRIRLNFQSPWNLAGMTSHNWSVMFSLSGASAIANQADAEATAIGLWEPIRQVSGASGNTCLMGWSYYPSGATIARFTNSYAFGAKPATASGYAGSGRAQQLEVCALARCPVGKNAKGRNEYLHKWIHDVNASNSTANAMLALTNPATTLATWNSGSGPNSLVPIDPSSGEQGGPWSFEVHLFTHQLRRGAKRKKVPVAGNSVDIPPVP